MCFEKVAVSEQRYKHSVEQQQQNHDWYIIYLHKGDVINVHETLIYNDPLRFH